MKRTSLTRRSLDRGLYRTPLTPHTCCEVTWVIFPFCRWKSFWSSERLGNLAQVTQLGRGRARVCSRVSELEMPVLSTLPGTCLTRLRPPASCSLFPSVPPPLPSSSSVSPQPFFPVAEPAAYLRLCQVQGVVGWAVGRAMPSWEVLLS